MAHPTQVVGAPVLPTTVDPRHSSGAWQPPLPPLPPPPRRGPRRAGRRVVGVLAAVLFLAGLLLVLKLADSAGSGEANGPGTQGAGGASAAAASKAPPPKPSPVTTDGGLRFTVARFSCSTAEIGQWPVTKQPKGQFCLAQVKVDNLGGGSGRVWLGSQRLRDTAGNDYKPDEWSWVYYDDTRPLLSEIKAGRSVTGTLVFDVPKGASFDELVVKEHPLSSGTTVHLP